MRRALPAVAVTFALTVAIVTGQGVFAREASCAAVDLGSVIGRLSKISAGTTALAGDFTQKSRIKLFKQELTARGRFYFQRPNRIRWQYLAPDPSTLVVDGDKATMAMPGAATQTFDLARDPTMRAVFEQLTLWLGASSLERLSEGYAVAAGGSDATPSLVLTPKPGTTIARTFSQIELSFDRRLLLHEIRLREQSGDEKEIVFTRIERNPKLPADAFKP